MANEEVSQATGHRSAGETWTINLKVQLPWARAEAVREAGLDLDQFTEDLGAFVLDVARERIHQIVDEGWTPDHDDLHVPSDWAGFMSARVAQLRHPALVPDDELNALVQLAALALAEVEAWHRREP